MTDRTIRKSLLKGVRRQIEEYIFCSEYCEDNDYDFWAAWLGGDFDSTDKATLRFMTESFLSTFNLGNAEILKNSKQSYIKANSRPIEEIREKVEKVPSIYQDVFNNALSLAVAVNPWPTDDEFPEIFYKTAAEFVIGAEEEDHDWIVYLINAEFDPYDIAAAEEVAKFLVKRHHEGKYQINNKDKLFVPAITEEEYIRYITENNEEVQDNILRSIRRRDKRERESRETTKKLYTPKLEFYSKMSKWMREVELNAVTMTVGAEGVQWCSTRSAAIAILVSSFVIFFQLIGDTREIDPIVPMSLWWSALMLVLGSIPKILFLTLGVFKINPVYFLMVSALGVFFVLFPFFFPVVAWGIFLLLAIGCGVLVLHTIVTMTREGVRRMFWGGWDRR